MDLASSGGSGGPSQAKQHGTNPALALAARPVSLDDDHRAKRSQ